MAANTMDYKGFKTNQNITVKKIYNYQYVLKPVNETLSYQASSASSARTDETLRRKLMVLSGSSSIKCSVDYSASYSDFTKM